MIQNSSTIYRASILIAVLLMVSAMTACGVREKPIPHVENVKPEKAERIEFEETKQLVKNNVYLQGENVEGMNETQVQRVIEDFAERLDNEPENAVMNSRTWNVKLGKMGKKVDIDSTMNAVMSAEEGSKIKLKIDEVSPVVTSKKLKKNIIRIARYSTSILDNRSGRINNIGLASDKIDYKILDPGEEFSFNDTVGKRTEAKGYEEAPIIIRTKDGPKKKDDTGGGVCQISTTLYNAAEEAKLRITERHMHSKKVGYVPKGEDATVSYGWADLKFVNNRSYPVMIRIYLSRGHLTVDLIENRN